MDVGKAVNTGLRARMIQFESHEPRYLAESLAAFKGLG